jgi:AraC family transcriptional regulator
MLVLPPLTPGRYAEKSVLFPGRLVPLHALISSAGYAREMRPSYDWHGLQRGKTEFALLQYTTGGAGRMRHEDREYAVAEGQAMLLHFPHDNRYWLPPDSSHWEFVYLCLYGSEVTRICREVERRAGPLLDLGQSSPVVVGTAAAVHAITCGTAATPFAVSALAWNVSMRLADAYLSAPPDARRPPGIQQAARYCREHATEPLSVDALAAQAGYSRFHFSRLFAASEGMAPARFAREQRVRAGVSLLQTSDLSIKEVAEACGFCDATYFCKVFRRTMGLSPATFRRSGMYRS